MESIAENWLWILFGIFFISMHMFGHGGHNPSDRADTDDAGSGKNNSEQSSRRRH